MAWRAASWATCCAAKAVLLREPLKPTRPAVDQPSKLPCMSVIVTCVLLNVARMCATPVEMFLACLALMIFLALGSSANSSAAVGAATTGAGAAGSPALGASPGLPGAAFCGSTGALASAFSAAGALGSFGAFSFLGFVSSAI